MQGLKSIHVSKRGYERLIHGNPPWSTLITTLKDMLMACCLYNGKFAKMNRVNNRIETENKSITNGNSIKPCIFIMNKNGNANILIKFWNITANVTTMGAILMIKACVMLTLVNYSQSYISNSGLSRPLQAMVYSIQWFIVANLAYRPVLAHGSLTWYW